MDVSNLWTDVRICWNGIGEKMMKTPEDLCKEWAKQNLDIATHAFCYGVVNHSFLAGYKAAQEQLADAGKVVPDTCEHILDMSKMVDVSSLATLNNWISVEDKSPEINQRVLLATNEKRSIVTGYRLPPAGKNEPWFHTDLGLWCGTETVTHWQPLPEPPKEEG